MLQEFNSDVSGIRERARTFVESGHDTEENQKATQVVIGMLNDALATELVCVLRYRRHYYMAKGLVSEPIAAEFLEHSNEEQGHADMLADRITQLGGEPDFNPDSLSGRSNAPYTEANNNLKEMIKENLVAERIAIDTYKQMICHIGTSDPTTRRMLEEILATEETHADDLTKMLS